jgi:pilus assembly protein Flp/PilA
MKPNANKASSLKQTLRNGGPTVQMNIRDLISRFAKDESGAALLEYSILIGLITAGVIGFVTGSGSWVNAKWKALATAGIK